MTQRDDVLARLRRDPRVDLVARGLLAAQLGLTVDDLPLLRDATVAELLRLPSAVSLVVGAHRLLGELDAQLARAHPVDLDYPTAGVTVATVLTDDDDRVTVALNHDVGARWPVALEVDDRPLLDLTRDDAESVAYALLRLVALADETSTTPTTPPTTED